MATVPPPPPPPPPLATLYLQPLPFALSPECPIPWSTSSSSSASSAAARDSRHRALPPQLTGSQALQDRDSTERWLHDRYSECLYSPDTLNPIVHFCADVLRLRRLPSSATAKDSDMSPFTSILLGLSSIESKHRRLLPSLVPDLLSRAAAPLSKASGTGTSGVEALQADGKRVEMGLEWKEIEALRSGLGMRFDLGSGTEAVGGMATDSAEPGSGPPPGKLRALRDEFERREVMLQILILLAHLTLFPPSAEVSDDPSTKKKRKKDKLERNRSSKSTANPSTSSFSSLPMGRSSSGSGLSGAFQAAKPSTTPASLFLSSRLSDTPKILSDPAAALEMLVERLVVWQSMDEFEVELVLRGEGEVRFESAPRERGGVSVVEVKRNQGLEGEEEALGDWVKRFCVGVVEEFFLQSQPTFCADFHLKVFNHPITSASEATRRARSPSPTPSDTLSSTTHTNIRPPATRVERRGSNINLKRTTSVSVEAGARSRSPSVARSLDDEGQTRAGSVGAADVESQSQGMPTIGNGRTSGTVRKSTATRLASGKNLFKGREIALARAPSASASGGGAGGLGPLASRVVGSDMRVVLGKRKTMIVPKDPKDRRMSTDMPPPAHPIRSTQASSNTLVAATPAKSRTQSQLSLAGSLRGGASSNVAALKLSQPFAPTSAQAASAAFVAETPIAPRQIKRQLFTGAAPPVQQPFFGEGSASSKHALQPEGGTDEDALGEFMVDTDEEDEDEDHGRHGRKHHFVQEVPDTPQR